MGSKLKPIAIFGAGGFGLEVAMLVEHINNSCPEWEMVGFFDDAEPMGKLINGYPVLGGIERLNKWSTKLHLSLALGIPKIKREVYSRISNSNVVYPILIHPSVIMGKKEYIQIGEGSIICAGSIITTNVSIGQHVILNLACTVGHQVIIEGFSSFMPTCNVSGEAKIGKDVFFGTGAKIINGKVVGNNVTVGAGAVIISDIPDNVTVVGIPAKAIKLDY